MLLGVFGDSGDSGGSWGLSRLGAGWREAGGRLEASWRQDESIKQFQTILKQFQTISKTISKT